MNSNAHAMHRKKGFTLLEISMVLTIFSLLIVGIMSALTQNIRIAKQRDLTAKFDAIDTALMNYRRLNNRLPCPANATLLMNNQYFGVEAANNGTTCTGSTPAANATYTGSGITTVGGTLPVRTLGLPDDAMFDPWGGRFTYAVDVRATANNAFTTYPATDTNIGSIIVYDGTYYPGYDATNGHAITQHAVAVVVSHGGNGHGAYQISGATSAARKSWGSSNSDELKNCHCLSDGTSGTFDNKFVMHLGAGGNSGGPQDIYDDMVHFYTRTSTQMLSATEAATSR